jgi:hypothetical protein
MPAGAKPCLAWAPDGISVVVWPSGHGTVPESYTEQGLATIRGWATRRAKALARENGAHKMGGRAGGGTPSSPSPNPVREA